VKVSPKILVIEDEFLISFNLKEILSQADFEIVGMASTYEESIQICKSLTPDIAIVDINIDGPKDGIETAAFLKEVFGVSIIFLTAYATDEVFESAKAVQPDAYLTKPFVGDEVLRAVKLSVERLSLDAPPIDENKDKTLILNTGDGWHKVQIDDIIYIASDNNYCTFHLVGGTKVMVHKSLKYYESALADAQFYRCHQSYLINMSCLQKIEKKEGLRAVLKGDGVVPVARNRRPQLLALFLK